MSIENQALKNTLAQWSSGVTVVTSVVDDTWYGLTISSFVSLSIDPPLILICVGKPLYTHSILTQSGVFAVNILGADQIEMGKRFAGFYPEITDRFAGLNCTTAKTGSPILPGVLGWLDCGVYQTYDGGDHTIFVGEVLDLGTSAANSGALVYHNRQWGRFSPL